MSQVLKTAMAGVAIAAALVVAGCGGGDPPPPGTPSAAENLITPAVLSQQPAGSPQRALMGWWKSIQYNDLDGYLAALVAPLRLERQGTETARRDLALVSGEMVRAQPKVTEVETNDGTATLYARIETRQPVGATRYTTSSYPQAFSMVREGGEWKILDDFFIADRAAIVRRALRQAERSAASGG